MILLLDTHVVLWWLDDPAVLLKPARKAIADPRNEVLISAAVAWEIAIKRALGKLTAPPDFDKAMQFSGFEPMSITIAHALAAGGLPTHHRDPFDRLLIAQAQQEKCTLVSRDPNMSLYNVPVMKA